MKVVVKKRCLQVLKAGTCSEDGLKVRNVLYRKTVVLLCLYGKEDLPVATSVEVACETRAGVSSVNGSEAPGPIISKSDSLVLSASSLAP